VQLLAGGLPPLGRLLLEGAKRPKFALITDDALDRGGAGRADQFVLQVGGAHVEPQRLHLGAGSDRAEPAALQRVPEVTLLGGVAQAGQPDVDTESAGTSPTSRIV
jgi:hypothetical protein